MLNVKVDRIKKKKGFLSKNDFKKLYVKLLHEESVFIPEGLKFDTIECLLFLKSVKENCSGKINTNNVKFLTLVNSLVRDLENKEKRVLVIDNHNLFHRSYHSFPKMVNEKGQQITVLKATVNFLKWVLSTQDRYTHIIFSSEGGNLKRKQKTLNDEKVYKGNRSKTDPELKEQIKFTEKVLEELGFNVLRVSEYEADDVLASLASLYHVTAYTTDKDAYQLFVHEGFEILDPKTKEIYHKDKVIEKFGVTAEDFLNYQAIVGDTADNIPGIKGFGKVVAKELVNRYHSLENMINSSDQLFIENVEQRLNFTKAKLNSAKRKQQIFIDNFDNALKSRSLCTLNDSLFSSVPYDISYFSPIPYKNMNNIIKSRLSEHGINY